AANATNATLYEKLNFNFIRDIAPVAGIIVVPMVMVVNPSVPAKTVPDFIAYAKANPGKINLASGSIGGTSHVAGELFKMMTGADMLLVPYRGMAPAVTDLLGGQVQVLFNSLPASIGYIKADRLRALAVTTATRAELLPDIPTISEFFPGYEASQWYGLGVPKNTPAERSQEHARRDRRQAQQRGQCGSRRPQDEGPSRRPRRRGAAGIVGGVRQADRRGNRKVGQGGEVRRYQGGLMRYSINPVLRTAGHRCPPTGTFETSTNVRCPGRLRVKPDIRQRSPNDRDL